MAFVWEAVRAGVKKFIEPQKETDDLQPWNSELEDMFAQLLKHLKDIKTASDAKKDGSSYRQSAIQDLQSLRPYLEMDCFDYGPNFNQLLQANLIFNRARRYLLELWHSLLVNLDTVSYNDSCTYYKAISCIMRRYEFDTSHVNLRASDLIPQCSQHNLHVAYRYRLLTYQTYHYTAKKLSRHASKPSNRHPWPLFQFAGKQMGLLFFRLPSAKKSIIESMSKRHHSLVLLMKRYGNPSLSTLSSAHFLHKEESEMGADGKKKKAIMSEWKGEGDSLTAGIENVSLEGKHREKESESDKEKKGEELEKDKVKEKGKEREKKEEEEEHEPLGNGHPSPISAVDVVEDYGGGKKSLQAVGRRHSASAGSLVHHGFLDVEEGVVGKASTCQRSQDDFEIHRPRKAPLPKSLVLGKGKAPVPEEGNIVAEMEDRLRVHARQKLFKGWAQLLVTLAQYSTSQPEALGIDPARREEERVNFWKRDAPSDWLRELETMPDPKSDACKTGDPSLLLAFFLQNWVGNVLDTLCRDPVVQQHAAILEEIETRKSNKAAGIPIQEVEEGLEKWLEEEAEKKGIGSAPTTPYGNVRKKQRNLGLRAIAGNKKLWESITDYRLFIQVLLMEMEVQCEAIPRSLMDCSSWFLLADPELINRYQAIVMHRTNAFNVPAVLEVLGNVETWMKFLHEYKLKLPDNYDYEYFCFAIDMMLETDHHMLVHKTLSFLYTNATVFNNATRQHLFLEVLLKKHFFNLFLHWESTIRNTFHQIIIFKMLRHKRTMLAKHGFVVQELSSRSGAAKDPEKKGGILTISTDEFSVPNPEDDDLTTDAVLFAKIESYIQMTEDQIRFPEAGHYRKGLEVYVPNALMEYRTYLCHYYQWIASSQTDEAPKLTPISQLQDRYMNK